MLTFLTAINTGQPFSSKTIFFFQFPLGKVPHNYSSSGGSSLEDI